MNWAKLLATAMKASGGRILAMADAAAFNLYRMLSYFSVFFTRLSSKK
jgi:hypothetical protein